MQNAAPGKLDYVVTGTGRCGTVYMARLLSSVGVMCSHEAVFDQGGPEKALERLRTGRIRTSPVSAPGVANNDEPDWLDVRNLRADSSSMSAPFLNQPPAKGAAIVHVVRHPLMVISSFVKDLHYFKDGPAPFARHRDFVRTWAPQVLAAPTAIERACLYWIVWNEMIERGSAGQRYLGCRVEEMPSPELMDFLSVPAALRSQAYGNRAANSWRRRARDYVMADIPEGAIKERLTWTAARYGYDLLRPADASRDVGERLVAG